MYLSRWFLNFTVCKINVLSIKEETSLLSLFYMKLLHIYCLNTYFEFIQTNLVYPPLPTSFDSEK